MSLSSQHDDRHHVGTERNSEAEPILDLTHGVTLDIRQFEATRSADRPEFDYVDHTTEFASVDSFGIHIPEAVLCSGRDFPITTEGSGSALRYDTTWLRRLIPFKTPVPFKTPAPFKTPSFKAPGPSKR